MGKYEKFQFDNFIIDEDHQPYAEDWENSNIEVETPVEEISEEQIQEEDIKEDEVTLPEEDEKTEIPEENNIIEEIITYTEDEVKEKEERARREGYDSGYQEAKREQEEERNKLLSEINTKLLLLTADMSSQSKEADNQIINISASILHKLVPIVEKAQAQKLIKNFLEKNFSHFKNESRLAFYFHPETISSVQEEIARLANIHDYEGKISIHKDENMQYSDCRVEWENGGVERNSVKMLNKVDNILEANKFKD